MELYKLMQKKKKLDFYRNAFVNLAIPLFAFSEPVEPEKHTSKGRKRAFPEGWTLWDTMDIEGNMSFQELLTYFKSKFNLNVTSVAAGNSLVYNAYIPKYKERLPKKILDVWRQICADQWDDSTTHVDMSVECELEEDDTLEIDLPIVRFTFTK
jgi:ubiquitin-activating enzyme E1